MYLHQIFSLLTVGLEDINWVLSTPPREGPQKVKFFTPILLGSCMFGSRVMKFGTAKGGEECAIEIYS